jgi:hypothetical protein
MPKVSYCRTKADDFADLGQLLRVGAYVQHGSVKAAGSQMKTMSTGTFNSKVKSPEKMTLEELCDARKVCKVDKEALLDVLRRIL